LLFVRLPIPSLLFEAVVSVEPVGGIVELGRRSLEELDGVVRSPLRVVGLRLRQSGLGLRAFRRRFGLRRGHLSSLGAVFCRRAASTR
jgi:hypothetical protein